MAWIGAFGAWIISAFGASGLAAGGGYTLGAYVVGGAVVGAAIGAVYSLATGYNLGKGILYGAIGGAAIGAGAYAVGFGATQVVSVGGEIEAGTGAVSTASNAPGWGSTLISGKDGESLFSAGSLFSKEGLAATTSLAALGSQFMKGGMQIDPDAELAQREKDRQAQIDMNDDRVKAQLEAAKMQAGATMAGIKEREATAAKELAENARQFDKTIGFEEYKYEDDKSLAEQARKRQKEGISKAAEYVAGNVQSVSLVKANSDRRNLRHPIWLGQRGAPPEGQEPESRPDVEQTGILQVGRTA